MSALAAILGAALLLGAVATLLRLPPLVGFLLAGFLLHGFGVVEPDQLEILAEFGVTLLLFTIGLKFDLRIIARREVWGAGLLHLCVMWALATALILGFGFVFAAEESWQTIVLLGFAFSFSSTVLCVKVLEDRGDDRSLYGQVAIGILLLQDVAAVLFLAVAKGRTPSPWAIALIGLIPAIWLARRVLDRLRRGELVVLFGVAMALVPGWWLFELVDIKGDLGALLIGLALGSHPRAAELSKSLFSLKELMLIGFFVSIGFGGLPSLPDIAIAFGIVVVLVPVKTFGYAWLLAAFRLRPQTSAKAGIALSNLSEFAIIVVALAGGLGLMKPRWIIVVSVAVALSMALSTLLNLREVRIGNRLSRFVPQLATERIVSYDQPIDLSQAEALVLGVGRIGQAAYDRLEQAGQRVWGIENDEVRARELCAMGYRIIEEDVTDSEFWQRVHSESHVDLVLLAMPAHEANSYALMQLEASEFTGKSVAAVTTMIEAESLRGLGVDSVFNLYEGAGLALAEKALELDSPGETDHPTSG